MGQGQPLTDEQRAAITADLEGDTKSRNEIAREHGVSPSTVSKIAREKNKTFDRAKTEKATRARVSDMAALRAQVAEKYLRKADELLDQMDEPHLVFSFGGKENTYNEQLLERPPTGDLRNLMTASAVALDKHLKIISADTESGSAGAASMLSGIADALQVAAEALDAESPDEG